MKPIVEVYLNLGGRCEEAVEFYKKALGAQVDMLMSFKDSPEPDQCPPGNDEKIMHCAFRVGSTCIMASDGMGEDRPEFRGFSLSIRVGTEDEARKYFAALSEGGQVEMPLARTFWSPLFGVVSDRFGVSWMLNVCAPQP